VISAHLWHTVAADYLHNAIITHIAVVINNTVRSILMSQSEKQLVKFVMQETNTMKFLSCRKVRPLAINSAVLSMHSTGTEAAVQVKRRHFIQFRYGPTQPNFSRLLSKIWRRFRRPNCFWRILGSRPKFGGSGYPAAARNTTTTTSMCII